MSFMLFEERSRVGYDYGIMGSVVRSLLSCSKPTTDYELPLVNDLSEILNRTSVISPIFMSTVFGT